MVVGEVGRILNPGFFPSHQCLRLEHLAPSDKIIWGGLQELTLVNTLVAGVLFFICHDLLWTPLHRLFHSHGTLYKLVHKYHHKQVSTRMQGHSSMPQLPQ